MRAEAPNSNVLNPFENPSNTNDPFKISPAGSLYSVINDTIANTIAESHQELHIYDSA